MLKLFHSVILLAAVFVVGAFTGVHCPVAHRYVCGCECKCCCCGVKCGCGTKCECEDCKFCPACPGK